MDAYLFTQMEPILRLALAAFLAGIIGLDREKRGVPAGMRTYMIVCVASSLATIAAIDYFPDKDSTARIAAGLITGIGFLGAGSIMSSKEGVHGLTTAAGVWAMCMLGISTGLGQYTLSIGFTLVVYIILKMKSLEERYKKRQMTLNRISKKKLQS